MTGCFLGGNIEMLLYQLWSQPEIRVETLGIPFISCGIWAKCLTAPVLSFHRTVRITSVLTS